MSERSQHLSELAKGGAVTKDFVPRGTGDENARVWVEPREYNELRNIAEHLASQYVGVDSRCHRGLCNAEACTRCQWILRARAVLGGWR